MAPGGLARMEVIQKTSTTKKRSYSHSSLLQKCVYVCGSVVWIWLVFCLFILLIYFLLNDWQILGPCFGTTVAVGATLPGHPYFHRKHLSASGKWVQKHPAFWALNLGPPRLSQLMFDLPRPPSPHPPPSTPPPLPQSSSGGLRPWSPSPGVSCRWRCACWWPPRSWRWRAAGASVWGAADTSETRAAHPSSRCRTIAAREGRGRGGESVRLGDGLFLWLFTRICKYSWETIHYPELKIITKMWWHDLRLWLMKLLFHPKPPSSLTSDEKWKMLFFFFLLASDLCRWIFLFFLLLLLLLLRLRPPFPREISGNFYLNKDWKKESFE